MNNSHTATEYAYNGERAACDQRLTHIHEGYAVSLITYDAGRGQYVFISEKPIVGHI